MSKKTVKFYIDKIDFGQHKTMPLMPGEAIKAVIAEHHIPAIAYGYYADVIGVETKKQVLLWKDTGTRIVWIGMLDKDTGKISLPKKENKIKSVPFNSYKALHAEIEKRDYENIKGLKAKITEKEYDYFLNVLPPLGWKGTTFYMSEFLSGELTMKFFKKNNICYCEVADYREEHPNLAEEEYLLQRY